MNRCQKNSLYICLVLLGILYLNDSGKFFNLDVSNDAFNEPFIIQDINYIEPIAPERDVSEVVSTGLGKTRQPWPNDASCEEFNIRTAKHKSLPICALASFPGSGNTWLRSLLDGGSGIFSGSQYHDINLHNIGFLGEYEEYSSGTTLVQKTHDYDMKAIRKANRTAIFLIRNPYKALLSFHNYLQTGSHVAFASVSSFNSSQWSTLLHKYITEWEKTAINWIQNSSPERFLVIPFENIKYDPLKEIFKCLKFLGISPNRRRLSCLLKNLQDLTKRPSQCFPSDMELFDKLTRETIDASILKVHNRLILNGFEGLPLSKYSFYKDKENDICTWDCSKLQKNISCYDKVDYVNLSRLRLSKKKFGVTVKTTVRSTQSPEMKNLLTKLNQLRKPR